MYESLVEAVLARLEGFTPQGLANVVHSLAAAEAYSAHSFRALARQVRGVAGDGLA